MSFSRSIRCARTKQRVIAFIAVLLWVFTVSEGAFAAVFAEDGSSLDSLATKTFTEDRSVFLNPNKGWHAVARIAGSSDFSYFKSIGVNVVLLTVDLGEFLTGPISEEKLSEIRLAFDEVRENGLTALFRAAYDFDGKELCEPADIGIIKNHIRQLGPIFGDNEELLIAIQAGFLGPWGEWHASYYGDPIPVSVQMEIVTSLLAAAPERIPVLVRRPMFIRQMAAAGLSASELARIGYHDDSLLSSSSDMGTYVEEGYSRADELSWINANLKSLPFSGESSALSEYSDPPNAMYELDLLHAQTVNHSYHPDVIQKWKTAMFDGMSAYDYIAMKMGYRFVMSSASLNTDVRKGGALRVSFEIKNDGFGNLLREQDLEIILEKDSQIYRALVFDDARTWTKEAGVISRDYYCSVPSELASGTWNVYLSLSSPFSTQQNNPDYAIRFASSEVWDEVRGFNHLGEVEISASLPNGVAEFKQISRADAENLVSAPPSPPEPEPPSVSSMSVSNDNLNLSFLVKGNLLSGRSQFFIDSDNDVLTGFQQNWIYASFDYLIEDGILYQYSGAGDNWAWTEAAKTTYANDGTTVSSSLPLSSLGLKAGDLFKAAFISGNDASLAFPRVNSTPETYRVSGTGVEPPPTINGFTVEATNTDKTLTFSIEGKNLHKKKQIFINADNNASTGLKYLWRKSGFEYLIENGVLYRYSGNGRSWSWRRVSFAPAVKSPSALTYTIHLRKLKISDTFSYAFILNDSRSLTYPKINDPLAVKTLE